MNLWIYFNRSRMLCRLTAQSSPLTTIRTFYPITMLKKQHLTQQQQEDVYHTTLSLQPNHLTCFSDIGVYDLPPVKHLGFASACAPGSPGRPAEYPINQYVRPPPRKEKTFIHNHRLSMDPCLHPYIFYHHAQYVAHDLGPAPQPTMVAQFSYCSTPLYHDIQPPTFISWTEDVLPRENDPEWDNKTDERLLWRGSNTGINHNNGTRWRYAQRIQLVSLTNELNGTVNVLMPSAQKDSGRVGNGTEMRKALINPAMMDIAFSNKPIACDPPYCDYLQTLFEWRKVQNPNGREAGNHKYIVDVSSFSSNYRVFTQILCSR